jgi:hypothetical protein
MKEVATIRLPQINYWMETGKVAAGKLLHAGATPLEQVANRLPPGGGGRSF